jgi:molybdopterin converting factor small subunit
MPEVTIRYFAAARTAAGESSAAGRPELARVLGICTFLLDGQRADPATVLHAGAQVDALPPFAGG